MDGTASMLLVSAMLLLTFPPRRLIQDAVAEPGSPVRKGGVVHSLNCSEGGDMEGKKGNSEETGVGQPSEAIEYVALLEKQHTLERRCFVIPVNLLVGLEIDADGRKKWVYPCLGEGWYLVDLIKQINSRNEKA